MKCSRVALSLLMAAFGGAVIALGPAEGRGTSAADFGPQPPPCMDSLGYENQYQGATDWRDIDADRPHYGEYRQEEPVEPASTHEAYRSYYEGDEQGDQSANTADAIVGDNNFDEGMDASDSTEDTEGMDGSDDAATDEAADSATDEAVDSGDDGTADNGDDETEEEDASPNFGYEQPIDAPYGYRYDYYKESPAYGDVSGGYEPSCPTEKYGCQNDATESATTGQQGEETPADECQYDHEYDYTHDDFRVGDPEFVPYVPSENPDDAMEATGGETSEGTYNAGDADEPAADANEPSGTESYSDDARMSNEESNNSFDSESNDDNAYEPAENVGEAYGRFYEPNSEATETPSFESNPKDEFGTENESAPVVDSSTNDESGTDNESSTDNESGADSEFGMHDESNMDNSQNNDAGEGYSEQPTDGNGNETTESESTPEPTTSGSEDPYTGDLMPTQGRSAFEIIKTWTENSLSNFDGAIRNIALPTVWLELPSLAGVTLDERTASDAVLAGEQTAF